MTEHNLPVPDDAPWLNLSSEEIQQLRNNKKQLTDGGMRKIRELMRNQEPYPDAMFEFAEKRERSNRVLSRYNDFYNLKVSGLPHGTTTTMEQLQAITLDCAISSLRCEHLNQEYTHISISDIENLIEALYEQSNEFLKKVKEFNDSADGVV